MRQLFTRESLRVEKNGPVDKVARPVSKGESQPNLEGYTAPAGSKERPSGQYQAKREESQVSKSRCQLSKY